MTPSDSEPKLPQPEPPQSDAHPDENAGEDLSPAVRRLVRQYGLDTTQIHGTGPRGRLRVGDVMAALGSRGAAPTAESDVERDDLPGCEPTVAAAPSRSLHGAIPVTSIFECDMTAVLAHRKQMLAQKSDFLLTSYYIVAAAVALRALPEVNGSSPQIDIAVALTAPGGSTATPVLRDAQSSSLANVNEKLRDVHHALSKGRFEHDDGDGSFLVYHHGVTGSILATPTPLAPQHAASLGVGRIRRKVAVQNVSDQSGPRIAPMCYVSVTFRPDELDLHRANQFLNLFVRRLERWPQADAEPVDQHPASS